MAVWWSRGRWARKQRQTRRFYCCDIKCCMSSLPAGHRPAITLHFAGMIMQRFTRSAREISPARHGLQPSFVEVLRGRKEGLALGYIFIDFTDLRWSLQGQFFPIEFRWCGLIIYLFIHFLLRFSFCSNVDP